MIKREWWIFTCLCQLRRPSYSKCRPCVPFTCWHNARCRKAASPRTVIFCVRGGNETHLADAATRAEANLSNNYQSMTSRIEPKNSTTCINEKWVAFKNKIVGLRDSLASRMLHAGSQDQRRKGQKRMFAMMVSDNRIY